MSLIDTIQSLQTTPRNQEEEYEYTSDFLEWFYHNIYREQGFNQYPILYQVIQHSGYETIRNQCKQLMNINYTKNIDNEFLVNSHNNMKQWLISTLQNY
jgi:hypothetical protein